MIPIEHADNTNRPLCALQTSRMLLICDIHMLTHEPVNSTLMTSHPALISSPLKERLLGRSCFPHFVDGKR